MHEIICTYLVDVRTVQVGRPFGIEAASPRVVQTHGKDLGLLRSGGINIEPYEFAMIRGTVLGEITLPTVPGDEVEIAIIFISGPEENLASMLVVGRCV